MEDTIKHKPTGFDAIFDVSAMRNAAEAASNLMKIMANSDRLLLLCQLSQHEKSVGELEELTGIKQPSLSQQLTVLRESSLVSTRRDGKNIFYSIANSSAMKVMHVLYQEFCLNNLRGAELK